MVSGLQLINQIEQLAPTSLGMPGDPIGVQVGDVNREVKTVMVTLDVRPEVVEEAVANQVDMIIAHHPAMFRPVGNLDYRDPQKRMYGELAKHDILVYAAHTNLDRAPGGMNDWLASALKLQAVVPFIEEGDACHMGRVGQLEVAMPLRDFVQEVKRAFGLHGLRVIAEDLSKPVQKVAVLGGDGGKFYLDAQAAGADVYITGDVYYHTGHDMLAHHMPVIDPGHHVEVIMVNQVRTLLQEAAQANDWPLSVLASTVNTEPFTFM